MTRTGTTRGVAAVAAGLFAAAALAQQPRPADPIDAARAAQRIADQKAEAEVIAAVRRADQLARTNPARAAQELRALQASIGQADAVSPETRKTLAVLLQAKLAALQGKADPLAGPTAPTTPGVKENRKAVFDAYEAEVKAVREGVELVKRYQDANRKPEADRVLADLTAKYPNNPAVLHLAQKDNFADRVAESQVMAKEFGDRFLASQNNVFKSAMPGVKDVEFPADWKQKTKNRTKGVELTAKEKSLIAALDRPLTVGFNNRPLEEALQDLSNMMDQPLSLDKKSFDDLGVDLKKPVSLDAKGLSARTVLRQLLGAQGMTFVVKDEMVQVMTVEKARETLVTRVYYLGDLVQGIGPFGGSLTWGPLIDYQQTVANVKLVMDSIQSSVDPLSWKERGGPGTITFHFPSMSLIVRASSEVHATLGSKLGGR